MDLYNPALRPLLVTSTLSILLMLLKKKRRKRRWWIRPMLLQRKDKGQYDNLFKFICDEDDEQFFKYTRMRVETFKKLLNLVGPSLKKRSRREHLHPEHRLVITLYYLAHGGSMQLTAWSFYLSKSLVSNIIRETCQIIWDILSPIHLSEPTQDIWKNKAEEFDQLWNLPCCIGAMDGKHITIQAPKKSGSLYFNYKKSFSIVLMAVCDANYKFTLVDIGAYGSQSDGGIFKESAFGKALESNILDVPPDSFLPGTDSKFPYFLAADEAFPLKRYIMRPFPGTNLTEKQTIYNYRLSRARRVIENSFGILVNRWRVLRNNIIAEVSTVERIVCATIALHNFLKSIDDSDTHDRNIRYCHENFVNRYDDQGVMLPGEWRTAANHLLDVGRMGSNYANSAAVDLRNRLSEYLVSPEGEVTWQYVYVKSSPVELDIHSIVAEHRLADFSTSSLDYRE